jgi:sugar phosphate isomerase/epimerase
MTQPPADQSAATPRRSFLRAVGAAAGAAFVAPLAGTLAACSAAGGTADTARAAADTAAGAAGAATPSTAAATPLLGVQLYTLRDALAKDLDGTFAALQQIGYRNVETFTLFGRSAADMRAALDRHGLAAPSGHHGLADLRASSAKVFDESQTLGHRLVILPYLMDNERTVDNYKRLVDECDKWGAEAKARGMIFGYHNHDFEFAPLAGGQTGWDILVGGTDPALVKLETDVYWMTKAGRDPVDFLVQNPTRVVALHAKDATAAPERKMADVGKGTIDFKRLIAEARKAGVVGVFVERDDPTDAVASARAGFEYLRPLLS